MPLVGYYPVDERWDLHTGGRLRGHHVAVLEIEASGRGYRATHYDVDGEVITSVKLDREDVAPVAREYRRVGSLEAALDAVRDRNRLPPEHAYDDGPRGADDFDFTGGGL